MKFETTVGTPIPCAIFVHDTSKTAGEGLAIAYNTASLVCEYRREGQSSWTSFTPVTGTLGTYVDRGLVADGGLTGAHVICPPAAAFASGAKMLWVRLYGAANMAPVLIEIALITVNKQNATNMGLGAIPNVSQGNAGALAIGDAYGKVNLQDGSVNSQSVATDAISPDSIQQQAADKIAGAMADLSTLNHTDDGTFGKQWKTVIDAIATAAAAIAGKLPSKSYIAGTSNSDGDVQMDEATGNFAGTVGGVSGLTKELIATEVDSVLSDAHDSGSWAGGGGGGGTGEFAIVLVAKTTGGTPIPGVRFTVQLDGSNVRAGFGDSSGQFAVNLDADTYTVLATMYGFVNYSGSLTVSANANPTITLTAASPTLPDIDGLCDVTALVIGSDGEAIEGAHVSAELQIPTPLMDVYLISRTKVTDTTDSDGAATLRLIRYVTFDSGGTYRIRVSDSSGKQIYDQVVKVPDQDTCTFDELEIVS